MVTAEEARRRGTVPVVGLVVLATGLALMAVLSWRSAGSLPDPVIFTGTGKNGADQQAPRILVLTAMPLLSLVLAGVLLAAQRWRRAAASALKVPLWRDDRAHSKAVNLGLQILVPVLLALHLLMLRAAEGDVGSGLSYVSAAVAILVIIVGNLWPKQVPGVPDLARVRLGPETQQRVDSGLETQRRSARPTGIAMVLLGLAALACSWLVPSLSLGISLLAAIVLGGVIINTWRSALLTRRR